MLVNQKEYTNWLKCHLSVAFQTIFCLLNTALERIDWLIDSFNTDSFSPTSGGLSFTRVRVKSQTERISHGIEAFFKSIFHNFFIVNFKYLYIWKLIFDLLRFEPVSGVWSLTDAFDSSATLIPLFFVHFDLNILWSTSNWTQ